MFYCIITLSIVFYVLVELTHTKSKQDGRPEVFHSGGLRYILIIMRTKFRVSIFPFSSAEPFTDDIYLMPILSKHQITSN